MEEDDNDDLIEPIIVSEITDGLPKGDPRNIYGNFSCRICNKLVHSCNEVMDTWVETGKGIYCLQCFAKESEFESTWDYALKKDYPYSPVP